MMVPLELFCMSTPRFELRPITNSVHASTLVGWYSNPRISQYLELRWHNHNVESVSGFIERHQSDYSCLVGIFDSEKLIGYYTLQWHPIHRVCDMGVLIGEVEYWRMGILSETRPILIQCLFDHLNVFKIVGRTILTILRRCEHTRDPGGFLRGDWLTNS